MFNLQSNNKYRGIFMEFHRAVQHSFCLPNISALPPSLSVALDLNESGISMQWKFKNLTKIIHVTFVYNLDR